MPSGTEVTDSGTTRVWESIEVKINLGNYSSGTVAVGASSDVFEDETTAEALDALHEILSEALNLRVTELGEKYGE